MLTKQHVLNLFKSIGVHKSYEIIHREPAQSVLGVIHTQDGDITIQRGHSYYWVVNGKVPLDIAKELYADSIGKEVIRVDGNCMCPAPEAPWIQWFLYSGKQVIAIDQKAAFEQFRTTLGEGWYKDAIDKYEFHDDPASIGAEPFITTYHIDTDDGLRLFVSKVKANVRRTDL